MTAETVELLKYLSIPVIAALVGWLTNWMAVKMTFYPMNFWGIEKYHLGWQGIIPKKARKMAAVTVDNVMSKLGTLSDIVQEIQPKLIAQHVVNSFMPHMETYVEECMMAENGVIWDNLPIAIKQRIVQRVKDKFPELVDDLVEELTNNAEDFIDLKAMVVEHISSDKALMNRIFLECGRKEFNFITMSGLYFGFGFGLIQMIVWWLFPNAWILPLFGLLVGLATNWLALNFIFRPLKPVNVLGFQIQGIFLKRQHEVSNVYTEIAANEIVTTERIAKALLSDGPKSDAVQMLVRKHMKRIVDSSLGHFKFFVQGALGMTSFSDIKEWSADKAIEVSCEPFDDKDFNDDRAKAVKNIMLQRMLDLTPQEFQNMLRPAFQEDEWILISAGGVLGLLAGTAQLVFIFGHSIL